MQHWYTCQAEVAPRGVHMHDCLYCPQSPRWNHAITHPEVTTYPSCDFFRMRL